MDERLAGLNHRVAAAADAWLVEPRDTGVYARLVAAIEARRAYLNPTLGEVTGTESPSPGLGDPVPGSGPVGVPTGAGPDEELLDELADTAARPVVPIAEVLGDPPAFLSQLRRPEGRREGSPDDQPTG